MTDEDRQQPGEEIKSRYEIVSSNENALNEEELYSFRSFHEDGSTSGAQPSAPKQDGQPKPSTAPVAANSGKAAGKKPPLPAMVAAAVIPVLIVAIVLIVSLQRSQPPYIDLGSNIFSSAGLQGHLIMQWEGKAEYRLRIEPIDQQHLPGFAAAVSHPPRPITVAIRLIDSSGAVLCNKNIPLQADPNYVSVYSASDTLAPTAKKDTAGNAGNKAGQAGDLAQQDAREFENKRGKDIFQSEINPEGNIAAVRTQGDLPCTASAYKHISAWDMTTDYPFADLQDALQDHQKQEEKEPSANSSNKSSIATLQSLPAPIEGDTAIIGDNLRRGIVETGSGKVFVLDKSELKNPEIEWFIFPAVIHYRCDKKASCALTRPGTAMAEHARLKK